MEIIRESICYENLPNLKKIDTDVFLRISVAFVTLINIGPTQSLLLSDLGKGVISKMASKMAAMILQ